MNGVKGNTNTNGSMLLKKKKNQRGGQRELKGERLKVGHLTPLLLPLSVNPFHPAHLKMQTICIFHVNV